MAHLHHQNVTDETIVRPECADEPAGGWKQHGATASEFSPGGQPRAALLPCDFGAWWHGLLHESAPAPALPSSPCGWAPRDVIRGQRRAFVGTFRSPKGVAGHVSVARMCQQKRDEGGARVVAVGFRLTPAGATNGCVRSGLFHRRIRSKGPRARRRARHAARRSAVRRPARLDAATWGRTAQLVVGRLVPHARFVW